MTAKSDRKDNSTKANNAKKHGATTPAVNKQTAPVAVTPTTPAPTAPKVLTIAEQLNAGKAVEFPKGTNAVKVTIDGKTKVILKADADTLKGAGVATVFEFGTVKNDSKGHPDRATFVTGGGTIPASKTPVPSKKPAKSTEPAPTGYPKGTLREALLLAGAKPFKTNEELVERVGFKVFKKEQVARCIAVVADQKNRFNGGVSKMVKAADGSMMLVAAK